MFVDCLLRTLISLKAISIDFTLVMEQVEVMHTSNKCVLLKTNEMINHIKFAQI